MKEMIFPEGAIDPSVFSEIQIAPQFNSVYLVHVHDTFIKSLENGQFSINVIMEYCEGGNLEQLNYKNNPLPEDVCTFLLYLMS